MIEWTIDNIIYLSSALIIAISGGIAKIIHSKSKKPMKNCPNIKIIENDLNNLKNQFEGFNEEIRDLIETETKHGMEVHKMIFEKMDDIASKIDYTRGQVDQHLKNN